MLQGPPADGCLGREGRTGRIDTHHTCKYINVRNHDTWLFCVKVWYFSPFKTDKFNFQSGNQHILLPQNSNQSDFSLIRQGGFYLDKLLLYLLFTLVSCSLILETARARVDVRAAVRMDKTVRPQTFRPESDLSPAGRPSRSASAPETVSPLGFSPIAASDRT